MEKSRPTPTENSRKLTAKNRSVTESVAIAFLSSDWSSAEMAKAGQMIFAKRQAWIPELAIEIRKLLPDRPSLRQLIRTLNRETDFPDLLKRRNLKRVNLQRLLQQRSPASVEWPVPRLQSSGELASHLGISPRQLKWLTRNRRPPTQQPDQRSEHYDYRWIKKRSTGSRLVESPKFFLKQAQRLLLDDVLRHIPTHPSAHGFCRRRSVHTFVEEHIGKRFCLKMDLQDFFPSIQAGRIYGLFRSVGFPLEVTGSLTRLCTNSAPPSVIEEMRPAGVRGAFEVSKLYGTAHLPQGAPTSPMLANLIAFRLDSRLAGFADSLGVSYSRYADDLLFSGDQEFARRSKGFATAAASIVTEEGFHVNFRKTRFVNQSQRQMAAGIVINQKKNLARREFDQLKAILFNCVKHGGSSQNRNNQPNFEASLAGRIAWVSQLNRRRGNTLLRLFQQIQW